MIKLFKILLVFLILPSICMCNTIDIYYPNNNTTTDIYYSIGDNYTHIIGNNISGNLTCVILNDELIYDNVLESPHKTIQPIFNLIFLIIILFIIILIVWGLKRLF